MYNCFLSPPAVFQRNRSYSTVRPVTNASALLTLPSSFGAIQLGETFSGILAVNNESAAMVDCVNLRVEMQTAASKVLLADIGGPTLSLVAGDTRVNGPS